MAATKLARCIICGNEFETNKRGQPRQYCGEKCKRLRKRQYEKDYYENHLEIRKLQKLQTRRKLRMKIIVLLGGKCIQCGESDVRCLQIDHINGGGGKERKSLSVWKYYQKVLESVKMNKREYQCLCANCNFKKRNAKNQLM